MPKTSKAKQPLILIHGFRGAPSGLAEVAAILEKAGYETFLPKIPPFAGANELFDYNPHTYADYIAGYIYENQLERPVLIGHSMGSVIATATAHLHPDLINDRVILMSPISKRPPLGIRTISPLSAYLPSRIIDYTSTRFLFVPRDPELFSQIMHRTSACSQASRPSKKATIKATRFSTSFSVADFSTQDLQKHFLVIAGEQDRLIKREATEKIARDLNATTVFLPGTGHLHNYEQPQETAQAILDFLDERPTTKAPL